MPLLYPHETWGIGLQNHKIMLELKGKYCKDCKIYTDNIEQDALSMIYHFLDHPMFEQSKIRIMPDVHAGKDIVVGFTVPFTNHVNPDHVGGDIGCSVSTAITDLKVNEADYPAIEKAIRENVKFGMTIHQKAVYDYKELYKHLQNAVNKARQEWPEMVNTIDVSEKGITAFLKRINQSEHMFYHSIGTVGGGNHFVEVGITPEGNYAFTVHCGSRNLGQKVWKYWKMESGKLAGVTNGYLVGEAMKGYITDMVISQAYAEYNHKVIDRLVVEAIISGSGKKATITEQIYTTHNYIDFGMKMLRKGAVAAPEGKKLVIPFNNGSAYRADEVAGSLHALESSELLLPGNLVVNFRHVHIGDVTHFLLREIGNSDHCNIAFNLYPFMCLAIFETFDNFAHINCFLLCYFL